MADQDARKPISSSANPKSPFAAQLSAASPEELLKLFDDSRFDVEHLNILLERKDLPGTMLEEIGRQKEWTRNYQVRRALAFHPRVPRTLGLRLIRDLHLMDLVKLSFAPAAVADLHRVAEDQVISRLAQLTLGEKLALARQASARVVGALILEGHPRAVGPALGNPRLTEAQVLKVLASEKLAPAVVLAIARHPRWAELPNVRLALLRHPQTPAEASARLMSHVTIRDLRALATLKTLSAPLRRTITHELDRRLSAARGDSR
jgi:hypothetical protein